MSGKPRVRWLLALIDILTFNLIFYELIKAIVLYPLKFHTRWEIASWMSLFLGLLAAAQLLGLWSTRFSLPRFGFQVAGFVGFIGFVGVESNRAVVSKGWDFSWLRPEVIKAPLWIKLLAPLSPGFTALFLVAVAGLLWLAIRTPGRRWLPWPPTIVALLLAWKVLQIFTPFAGWSVGGVGVPTRLHGALMYYLVMFAGPAVAIAVLFWLRAFSMAFRLTPLAFHMMLIGLNYMGALPVASVYDFLPVAIDPHIAATRTPGVSVYYPPPGTVADSSFLFARKLVVTPETMYLSYGPTCGLYAVDRHTRGGSQLRIPGLMRDLQLAPDGSELWGLNWLNGDFLAIGVEPFAIRCQRNIFDLGLTTPWNMLVDDARLFVSNVTHPIIAEFDREDSANSCSLRLRRSLDLFATGFTKFTDGAFGMHLDRDANRLYVSVGLVEERNLTEVVEIDLATFTVSRDVKLTGGIPIFPIAGRRSIWAPSFYNAEMHEVSLDSMKILRTITAGPNLLSLAQDERRGVFYGLCRASGMLQVIDDASGRIVKEVYVGPSPASIWLDVKNDRVYLASGIGILEIELPVFWGEKPARGAMQRQTAPAPG